MSVISLNWRYHDYARTAGVICAMFELSESLIRSNGDKSSDRNRRNLSEEQLDEAINEAQKADERVTSGDSVSLRISISVIQPAWPLDALASRVVLMIDGSLSGITRVSTASPEKFKEFFIFLREGQP